MIPSETIRKKRTARMKVAADPAPASQSQAIAPGRVQMSIRNRFNPIRGLTPERLALYLDEFSVGQYRNIAMLWDRMEEGDDVIKAVAPKRKKSVARHGFEILTLGNLPAGSEAMAEQQKQRLEYFFNNLTVTSALDQNQQGGWSLLVRQMMDAVGKKYSCHEIVWQPSPDGLAATFIHCPLWWFENTTGRMRFLTTDFTLDGVAMNPGEWMVTVGDGIMWACSIAYMFKHLPLKDWLLFCEKFGVPGVLGKTDAAVDSPEWVAFENAIKAIGTDWAAVCSRSNEITLLELKSPGTVPMQPLVENADRAIARLWRGSDLSTLSRQDGTGASLQGDESDILDEDDCVMVEETLAIQASRHVLEYFFPGQPCLVYVKIQQPEKANAEQDIKIDTFLSSQGFPLSLRDVAERYGRQIPDKAEPLLTAPKPEPKPGFQNDAALSATEKVITTAATQLTTAQAAVLQPVTDRLLGILELEDERAGRAALAQFRADLPTMLHTINADPATAKVLQDALLAGLLNGMAEGVARRTS